LVHAIAQSPLGISDINTGMNRKKGIHSKF
jgi:hypothetical protein